MTTLNLLPSLNIYKDQIYYDFGYNYISLQLMYTWRIYEKMKSFESYRSLISVTTIYVTMKDLHTYKRNDSVDIPSEANLVTMVLE